jgi:nucleotide-binding universal stress UspA family protein
MIENLIVGVDGHCGGRDAISLAQRLTEQTGQLTLAFVYAGESPAPGAAESAVNASKHERAVELLSRARGEADIDARLVAVPGRSVAQGLHLLARETQCDLLVLGSQRRGLLGRVLLGDNTHAALGGAPCAVAIAPAGYECHSGPIRKIGVGYNGSTESQHAVAVGHRLASQCGAELSALEAVSMPATAFSTGWMPPLGEVINDMLADAEGQLSMLQGVEPHVAYGDAAEELARYGDSVDLLIVGSRDYGRLGRLIHGSVSQQLARSVRCPLLVLTAAVHRADTRAVERRPAAGPARRQADPG